MNSLVLSIYFIICVPSDVSSSVYDMDIVAMLGERSSKACTGEARTNNKKIHLTG